MPTYSIFQINESLLAAGLLPIDKRTTDHIAWLTDLNIGMQWLNNKDVSFIFGSTASIYATSSTYNYGAQVNGALNFPLNTIYISITSSNIDQNLGNTASWIPYVDNFIGVNERARYYDSKMGLEWAANKWFHTNFRQPNGVTSSATHSDIYIVDNIIGTNEFYMGPLNTDSSYMGPKYSSKFMSYTTLTWSGAFIPSPKNGWFDVMVPAYLLTSNPIIPGGSQSVVNYINKYNYYGVPFSVQTY